MLLGALFLKTGGAATGVCVQPNTHELITVCELIYAEAQDQESSPTVSETVF